MNVLNKEQIFINCDFSTRDDIFNFLSEQCVELGIADDKALVIEGLVDRELESSTCFGEGIAMPHCRIGSISRASVLIAMNKSPVLWDTDNYAEIIIMLAIPDDESNLHIKVLSSIARRLVKERFVSDLRNAKTEQEIVDLFNKN